MKILMALCLACVTTTASLASEKYEAILFVADGMNRIRVKAALIEEISQGVPGSVIHLVACRPRHELIASLVIPNGSRNSRLRDRHNIDEWKAIGEFLRFRGDNYQLDLPEVAATASSVKQTGLPLLIGLVGDAEYRSTDSRGISFERGYVLRDGSLVSSSSPFSAGVADFPERTRVVFVHKTLWGTDHAHRASVVRFYRLFFKIHKAELYRMTSDFNALFQVSSKQWNDEVAVKEEGAGLKRTSIFPVLTDEPHAAEDDRAVQVRRTTKPVLHAISNQSVERVLKNAELNREVISIAINWESRDPEADIDIHVASQGFADELNFSKKITPFGQLYRDVLHTGDVNSPLDKEKWEWAQMNHSRVDDLKVWLHVYKAKFPSRVRVIMVIDGHRNESWINLPKKTSSTFARTEASGWKQIVLGK